MVNITVTTDFYADNIRRKMAETVEKKIRERIHKKLTFDGSEKLSIKVSVTEEGKALLTFSGPDEIKDEAVRRWNEK